MHQENLYNVVDVLPTLATGESLVVGDATTVLAIIKMDMPNPRLKSDSVEFYTQWKNEWIDIELTNTIKRWRNEE